MVAELASVAPDGSGQQVGYIPLDTIRSLDERPQVRKDWRHDEGQQKLDDLTQSMREHGLLTPVEVELCEDGTYRVIIGHRRIVAARRAGLHDVPAIVRKASDDDRPILQLVENIQRQDLHPLDEARAMNALVEEQGYNMETLARKLGVNRSYVKGRLRLFADDLLREASRRGLITPAGGLVLSGLPDAYAQPLRRRLQDGQSVTMGDLKAALAQKGRDGVVNPRSAWQHASGYNLAAEKERTDRRRRAVRHRRDDQHLSFKTIGEAWGVSESTAVRDYREAAELAPDVQDVPAQPRVTFNGVSLDPLIAKAQERAEAQPTQGPEPETPPHPRPTHSPLPWENHDVPRLVYSVDPAGLVERGTTEAITPPAAEAAPRPQPSPEPTAPRPASVPAPVEDADVARLRFMLRGAEQPCQDVLAAALNLGREKGWTCQDLWRKVQAAQRRA